MEHPEREHEGELKRGLSLPLLVFYGLGTILGAGIYVLVGEVAARSHIHTPLSFVVASILAAFTAFSFAELSGYFPKSAGEAVYVQQGFRRRWLSTTVGIMVAGVGMISSAAIARGFTGYLHVFVVLPDNLVIAVLVVSLCLLAIWGIAESVTAASIFTVIEISGLLLVVWVGRGSLANLPQHFTEIVRPTGEWATVFAGAFLAFYAFIGFEDMVNVAEEVKNPERNLPLGIIIALVVSTLLYFAVALTAVLVLPPEELAGSKAPLALVYEKSTGSHPAVISAISLFAVTNGALIQIIMAARVLYGLSSQGWLPAGLSQVNPRTRTPVRATLLVSAGVLLLALAFPLGALAQTTSFVTLVIFTFVNAALWRIKVRDPRPALTWTFPLWVPICGLLVSMTAILFKILDLAGIL